MTAAPKIKFVRNPTGVISAFYEDSGDFVGWVRCYEADLWEVKGSTDRHWKRYKSMTSVQLYLVAHAMDLRHVPGQAEAKEVEK